MEIAPKNNSLADENKYFSYQRQHAAVINNQCRVFFHLINHDCHQAAATAFRLRAALDDIGVAQNKNENPSIRWAIAHCPNSS